MIDWRTTDKAHGLEVRVFPDPVTMAEELKGRRKRGAKNRSSAVNVLIKNREWEVATLQLRIMN